MIGNTKIIQSQVFHNPAINESKVDHTNLIYNIPKIERSEKVEAKEDNKKLSRYQVNYQ